MPGGITFIIALETVLTSISSPRLTRLSNFVQRVAQRGIQARNLELVTQPGPNGPNGPNGPSAILGMTQISKEMAAGWKILEDQFPSQMSFLVFNPSSIHIQFLLALQKRKNLTHHRFRCPCANSAHSANSGNGKGGGLCTGTG